MSQEQLGVSLASDASEIVKLKRYNGKIVKSDLVQELREKGWKLPILYINGPMETDLERGGFKVKYEYSKKHPNCVARTYFTKEQGEK